MNLKIFIIFVCLTLAKGNKDLFNKVNGEIKGKFPDLILKSCYLREKLPISTYKEIAPLAAKNIPKIIMSLHTSTSTFTFPINNASREITSSPLFNVNKPVIIIIHGYIQLAMGDPNLGRIIRDLVSLGKQVLSLDHNVATKLFYHKAVSMAQYVGEKLGGILADMHSKGVTDFHLIGASLGAHISGFTGKTFLKLTGKKLQRISGLDAAGPCFNNKPSNLRLDSSDANFVDVIHSDMEYYGIIQAIGHVDIFPNGATNSPMCYKIFCSHVRAQAQYAESIKNNIFLATKCTSYADYNAGKCTSNPTAYMGYWLSNSVPYGTYFLNITSP